MSKTYRTAGGKMVDMESIAAKNQNVRAVGNMNCNARGDLLDEHGRPTKPRTETVQAGYNQTVGNPGARPQQPPPLQPDDCDLSPAERELDNDDE